MTRSEHISINKRLLISTLVTVCSVIGTGAGIMWKIGTTYVGYVKTQQQKDDHILDLDKTVNDVAQQVGKVDVPALYNQVQELQKTTDKHDGYFHYLTNTPQSRWHSFALNNK